MRFPVEWLREFAGNAEPPADLAARLTSKGFVVDAVEGAGDAAVLDVDVPANRPDVMNMYGMAREVAAAAGVPLRAYPSEVKEALGRPPASGDAAIAIEAPDLCGRYCARVVRGVRVGPSPDWIVRRLEAVGLSPVNNVVDATNYVLWELGHPLHAFDLSQVSGRRIVARRARKGEILQTLDGVTRHLDPEMLVIADAARAVAIAGVMGGAGTMISQGTTEVLLESAWFEPRSVRRTSKRLGLVTDASFRFERGADIEAAQPALDRAAALLADLAKGSVAPGLIDVRAEGATAWRTLHLRLRRIEALTGMRVDPVRAASALTALGFDVHPAGDGFEVVVPRHRLDVQGEADLVEEVARSIGYDAIPETIPHLPGTGAVHRFAHRREDTLRASLLASGFSEALTLSFVGGDQDQLLRQEGVGAVALANPMAEGQEILRTTLLPGLLDAVKRNINRGVRDVRLFEVGRVFRRVEGAARHDDRKHAPAPGTEEVLMAGLAASGLARAKHWSEPARETDLYDLKGAIEEALERLRIEASFAAETSSSPFRQGASVSIRAAGSKIGRLGILGAEAAARLGLKAAVGLAEIDLTALFSSPGEPMAYRALPRHPASTRDLALVVLLGTPWGEIERAILDAGGALIARVSLFDRYAGKTLPEGHVSLAVSIVYQHPERTLEASEVQAAEGRVLATLRDRFGISLRQ